MYTLSTRSAAVGPPPDVKSDDSKSATVFGGFARILDNNSPVWVSISPHRAALRSFFRNWISLHLDCCVRQFETFFENRRAQERVIALS